MKALKKIAFLVIVSAALTGCKAKFPKDTPIAGNTTFTISNFLPGCTKTANGGGPIDFDLVITIWYYDSNAGKTQYNEQKVVSDPGPIKQPVVITMSVPTNMFYQAEVNVVSRDCSRCASGHGGGTGGSVACIEALTSNGYIVAIPRASGAHSVYTWSANETINYVPRIPNKPNSCGCLVPL